MTTSYVESNIKIEILFDTITYSCLKIHVCKKSLSRLVLKKEDFKRWLNKYKDISVYLLFSATSIWFSRSPLSVVSACSIFQLKFSISASNWACWYSNCKGMISDVKTVKNPLVSPNVSWGFAPCSKHMDMCIAGCIYKEIDFDLECTSIITIQGYSILNISYSYCLMTNLHFASSFAESNKYCQSIQVPLPLITFSWNAAVIK